MKIFGWIQGMLKHDRHDESNRKTNSKSFETVPEPGKEEVNDWLHGLLAIGTFGKCDIKEDLERTELNGHPQGSVLDDLDSVLRKQDGQTSASASELGQLLPLRIQPIDQARCSNEPTAEKASLQHGTSIVLSRGKDVCADHKKNDIGKKSLSFLLKKILVCGTGFALPQAPIPESRTEKIFRAILHKKIYPQSSGHSLSAKKLLESRNTAMYSSNEDDMIDKANKGSKWVKTDSEYIVLEM